MALFNKSIYLISAFLFVVGCDGNTVKEAVLTSPKFTSGIQLEVLNPFIYEHNEKCSVDDGCLSLVPVSENVEGNDILGTFHETRIDAVTSSGSIVSLYLKEYDGFSIYEQFFLDDIEGSSSGDKNAVATAWPVFRIPDATQAPNLRYVTPGGYMAGWTLYAQGSIHSDLDRFRWGESGGIVSLLLQHENSVQSIVMSALREPMAANVELVEGDDVLLQWGIQGQAETIPKGFSIQFIVVSDETSFNYNVMKWGDLLQTYHGFSKMEDLTINYLGYWTDNGAAHYYNPLPFLSFQEMILDVYDYSVQNEIPFRYLQIDSWWYYKGEQGGLKNWTAKPYIFPDGIEYIHEQTGWPMLAHNRYFSNDTDYAEQNGGDYPFTIDNTYAKSLPLDKHFWDDLFDEGKLWGLLTYEQDWLDRQYEQTSALHTNLTLGSYWLNSMGISAAERDLTVQYCMAFPRHLLHSVALPAVTQIRVSDDYMLTPNQWRIGTTSLFAHALGLKPYKDNFWSTKVNENVVFNDCELVAPYDLDHPLKLRHSYGGRKNTTKDDIPCVPWTNFGYDAKYPHSGMRINLCRNPEESRRGSFCYTLADADIPEEEWEWDFCKPPVCDIDCYLFNGVGYLGSHSQTENGNTCVDWNGEYGIEGAKCRNPTQEEAPWCYITEDHSEREFCNNKCTEAIEPNSELQSAVSTLSAGPVGIGDKASNLNRDLIMKSCRADGLLLKPSKPLTAIDLLFLSSDYREIWTSDVVISDFQFGIIFMAEIDSSYTLSGLDLNLETVLSTDVIFFQNYPQELSGITTVLASSSITLPSCGGWLQFCIFYVSPLIEIADNRIALLGEKSKWSVVSPQRIGQISMAGDDIEVTVKGVEGEDVSIAFWDENLGADFTVVCSFASSNDMVINVISQQCL